MIPSIMFFISDTVFYISDWFFIMVFMSICILLKFSLISLHSLITIVLDSTLVECLPLFHLVLFPGDFSCSFIWGLFFFSFHLGCLYVFVFVYWVYLLCLPILIVWHYLVGVLWDPRCNLPDNLRWCSRTVVCVGYLHSPPHCCNWVFITVWLTLHRVEPQAGLTVRMDWPIPITVYKLLYGCEPHEAEFDSGRGGESGAFEISLWMYHLWRKWGPTLILSEANHRVCWFWDLLARTQCRSKSYTAGD